MGCSFCLVSLSLFTQQSYRKVGGFVQNGGEKSGGQGGQGVFNNGSRRREEADLGEKNTSASLPRRLRRLRRFLNSSWSVALLGAGTACCRPAGASARPPPRATRRKFAPGSQAFPCKTLRWRCRWQ